MIEGAEEVIMSIEKLKFDWWRCNLRRPPSKIVDAISPKSGKLEVASSTANKKKRGPSEVQVGKWGK